jgi:3-oxoacyl-[acyl-carrier protein] reductase
MNENHEKGEHRMKIETQRDLDGYQTMKGRVALITGASRGIGAATALQLGRHGTAVGVNYYQNATAAQAVVSAIQEVGGKALAVQADVEDLHQVEAMVSHVQEVFGSIDTLVLNAPARGKQHEAVLAPFLESTWEGFEAVVLGQLRAAFYPSQLIIPSMMERQSGSIIFVSATRARRSNPNFFALSVAKASVESMVRNLAEELGPSGIRVNAVGGGMILTDVNAFMPQTLKDQIAQRTPLRRNGRPEEVASAILFLASDQAAFITGAYLTVDGGNFIM